MIEVRVQNSNAWRLLLIAPISIGLFYYVFGYLPVVLWILGGAFLIAIPYKVLNPPSREPCIVLNDEGILDTRLKIGVIRWRDVKRAYPYSIQGIPFVCLDLHNLSEYEARRPVLLRVLSNLQRLFGMSPVAISASSLDLDCATLLSQIHRGCETAFRN